MSKQNQKNKHVKSKATEAKRARDAEASAEEVLHEEVFPGEHRANKRRACGCGCGHKRDGNEHGKCGCSDDPSEPKRGKKAHENAGKANTDVKYKKNGTRPTQKGYKMIDPSDESADCGKS